MIEAGTLGKRITIEQATTARNNYGEPVETWSTFVETWAAIEPLRGREFFAAQQFSAEVTHKVTIRYRTGVSAKMRVRYGSRYFRIESIIDPKERHEALEFMCVEVLS